MNVSLTPRLERFIRSKVASGYYNNASEVVREALRLLAEQETRAGKPPSRAETVARLQTMAPALRRRGVQSLYLYGSVQRDEATPASDIDLLIDLMPKRAFSLVDLVAVKHALEDKLGREVDLATRDGLRSQIRDRVLADAVKIF